MLPMQELVSLLEDMNYTNVQTYIQSGNVVFQSRKKATQKDAAAIGLKILEKKGFTPVVVLLSEPGLLSAVKNNPFPTDDGKALHFFFLESSPTHPKIEQLTSIKSSTEPEAARPQAAARE